MIEHKEFKAAGKRRATVKTEEREQNLGWDTTQNSTEWANILSGEPVKEKPIWVYKTEKIFPPMCLSKQILYIRACPFCHKFIFCIHSGPSQNVNQIIRFKLMVIKYGQLMTIHN